MHHGLIQRLKNRGPVALSSENPYLAANLLLAREMEHSVEIQGFVDHRGAPAAIELQKTMFSPLRMKFYYPEDREYFLLEEAQGSWIIDGPTRIPNDKRLEVAKLTRSEQGNPQIAKLPEQSPTESSPKPKEPEKSRITSPYSEAAQEDPFIARLNEVERRQQEQLKQGGFQSVLRKENPSKPDKPAKSKAPSSEIMEYQSLEGIIRAAGQHPAEITPKGDLVHYVTYSGETLSMISRWYTKDRANVGRLARINRIPNPDKLEIGDTIVIPNYLLKNKNRMTEDAVRALSRLAGG